MVVITCISHLKITESKMSQIIAQNIGRYLSLKLAREVNFSHYI